MPLSVYRRLICDAESSLLPEAPICDESQSSKKERGRGRGGGWDGAESFTSLRWRNPTAPSSERPHLLAVYEMKRMVSSKAAKVAPFAKGLLMRVGMRPLKKPRVPWVA